MKISVDWYLYTDGDFNLKNCKKYNGNDTNNDGYIFSGKTEFKSKDDDCISETLRYLEKMLCDIHVSYTHYYLIRDIYNMFIQLIDFVLEEECGTKTVSLGGNYSKTKFTITITN